MFRNRKFDFIKNRKKYFIFSSILMLVIILSSFIFGVDLDIRFKGGTILAYTYATEINTDEVKSTSEEILGEKVNVSKKVDKMTDREGFNVTITGKGISSDKQAELNDVLMEKYKDNDIQQSSITSVNPSAGREFFLKCIVAVVFGSLLMIIYIGFRFKRISGWSAGVTALVALLHDVLVVYGTFVIFRIPLNDSFIAVVLTILGYSINSTIVIYDRIRENKKFYNKTKDLDEIVNISINQTMARSINTSLMTVMAMVVICIVAVVFGVDSIVSFAFPMTMGLISGTYSSVCLASETWVTWQDYKAKKHKIGKKKVHG